MGKKIAILGGTFDPIHLGHIKMAEAVLRQIDVDEVYFMPSKIPPHKLNKNVTREEHRCNMVKLAIEGNNKFVFSDFDLLRKGPSYTADTLTMLKDQNHDLDIYFIIGGDSLKNIESWYKPEIVMANCTLLTIVRDDVDSLKMSEIIKNLENKYDCNIIPINMNKCDVSSTKIRNQFVYDRNFDSYKNILDRKVFNYIINNGLYLDNDYEIVLASENDRAEVLKLYKAQLGREFCPWNEDYPSNETIDFDLNRNALYIMKNAKEIIAAISVEEDKDVDNLECWNKDLFPGGELARLAVSPSWQNKGIARIMLLFGMKELKKRGYKSIHFLVNKKNKKALKSYSAFDFHLAGECFMYNQDFLCFEKEL